jgi:hypothetical protein
MPIISTDDGNGGRCFHPGDGEPAARRWEPVSPCFHPDDDDRVCFHPGDPAALAESRTPPVNACHHPAEDLPDAVAGLRTRGVNLCHHPVEDLAVDLHLSLTAIDERQLAVLAARRP